LPFDSPSARKLRENLELSNDVLEVKEEPGHSASTSTGAEHEHDIPVTVDEGVDLERGQPSAETKVQEDNQDVDFPDFSHQDMDDLEQCQDFEIQRARVESLLPKESELALLHILQGKSAAISAISTCVAHSDFESAKQLKILRDLLAIEQTKMWGRLAKVQAIHRGCIRHRDEAIKAEDFERAKELHDLQILAEECIRRFALRGNQRGAIELDKGCISLGTAAALGLLGGSFTVECWVICEDTEGARILTAPDSVASLAVHNGCLEVKRWRGSSHFASVQFPTSCWTHVAYSWTVDGRAAQVKIFQDGMQVGNGTEERGIIIDSEVRLGPFSGKMSEFRIWDHARSPDQVETWMKQRCTGTEEGLLCCMSLLPGRGLADATLDPGSALASGHCFAERGRCLGAVTWDGDFPPDLESHSPGTQAVIALETEESLGKAWQWLEEQHQEEESQRETQSARRKLQEHSRKEEKQREEELKQKEAELRLKEEEKQQAAKEYLRRRQKVKQPLVKLMQWTCPMASFGR